MNTIKIADWMAVHPYMIPGSADYAYLKIANKLYGCWMSSLLKDEYDQEVRIMISVIVAAYFEDVVSCTGLWRAFIRKHKELYGKYMPFYDINEDSYYEDEINLHDVIYLIWGALQKESYDMFINPENQTVVDLARRMYHVLDNEFEKVPVNEFFLDFIQDKKHYTDFFGFKEMANWLYFGSYLIGIENSVLIEEQFEDIDDKNVPFDRMEYAIRSEAMFKEKTGPLALLIKEWYAYMLKDMGMEKEIAIINAIESHATDYFLLKGVDETYLYLIDTQEKEYAVLRSSFNKIPDKAFTKKILVTSLVKYDGEWYTNGLSVWTEEENTYWKSVEKKKNGDRIKKEVYEKLLKGNAGSPIAYFKKLSELSRWLSETLNVEGDINTDVPKGKNNYVVFASPETDICVLPNVGYYIKDPKNPFYDPKIAEDGGVVLLADYNLCPSSMYHYLSENNMLPDARLNSLFGVERGRELVGANVDFIARFFRWNRY
jgi:hypothetical protein